MEPIKIAPTGVCQDGKAGRGRLQSCADEIAGSLLVQRMIPPDTRVETPKRRLVERLGDAFVDAVVGSIVRIFGISLMLKPRRRFYAVRLKDGKFLLTGEDPVHK